MSKIRPAALVETPARPPLAHSAFPERINPQESGDFKDVARVFGIKQSHLLYLDRERLIVSYLVKGRGNKRGKRLYDFASIRQLLASSRSNINGGQ